MYCPRCGKEHDEDAKFCSACGTALDPPTPAPAANEHLIRAYKLAIPAIGMCAIYTILLPIISFVVAPIFGDAFDGHWFLYEGGCYQSFIAATLTVVLFKIQSRIYKYAKSMGITLYEMDKD